ncbi:MAG: hypothetical protein IJ349_05390 [Clostridia bacterium]|nr:hypothetical protein [Clostridia bacterium]
MAERGRPPKFKNKKQLEKLIEEYFESCKGHILTDDEGNVMTDKHGNPVYVDAKPLTITGLALALGFNSRQTLLNYQEKEEFMDTITRAKARVEAYTEERLFDKEGAAGARFSLANNFKGWSEKQKIEVDSKLEDLI